MNKLQTVGRKIGMVVSTKTGRLGLKVKQYSPEILIGVGVVGLGVSTVMACKATLKIDSILEEKEDTIDYINQAKASTNEEEYTHTDYQRDITLTYIRTGVELSKAYGPAIVVGVASVGSILGAHNVMKKRNIAVAAAYKMLEKGFNDYRGRVIDELGEDKDNQFRYNSTKEKRDVVELDKDGKEKKVKKEFTVADPNGVSIYAKFFDETSTQWTKTPEYNLIFLKGQQQYLNDVLHSRGHVFLNEVYDVLGLDRSKAGAVVGWVLGEGDDYIDFNLYNKDNANFVNGDEGSVLLDFNVDGVIYDLI